MIEFISGLMTGGLFGILLMCLLQINRVNDLYRRINKAIAWVHTVQQDKDNKHLEPVISTDELDELLEILGGGADDE